MKTNLNLLFLTTLIFGILIAVSSSNWLGIWMGLELNMLSFIPMLTSNKNILNNEASLKYFLIQAVASIIFISSALSNTLLAALFNNLYFYYTSFFFMLIALLLKLGAAPFHNWFISIMNGLSWLNCFMLMTLQKITPLCILTYLIFSQKLIIIASILSLTVGSIGGLNQTFIKKILGFSSVNHLGWIFSSLLLTKYIFTLYFILYMIMNAAIIWITMSFNLLMIPHTFSTPYSWSLMIHILSLGGLPPFLGFLPKLVILQALLIKLNLLLPFILTMTTLITLFYYLRLIYSQITFGAPQCLAPFLNNPKHPYFLVCLNTVTFTGLFGWNLI